MAQDRLDTSCTHRLLTGPLGWLLTTGWADRLKMAMLPAEFRLARARALAFANPDPEGFLDALEVDDATRQRLRQRALRALPELDRRRQSLDQVQDQWDTVFWRGAAADSAARVALERRRRRLSQEALKPDRLFRFLSAEHAFAPVAFQIPGPEETITAMSRWLSDPASAYAASAADLPAPERSAPIPGPAGPESLLRFSSPSTFQQGVRVTARVYEPARCTGATGTFIYGSGLGMLYDLIRYWPEEDYMARRLAARGVRVILPESPWHGRRELPGRYSGEPYLARAPLSVFELFSTQVQETARLIGWARSLGSPLVGVGGVSLGGLVAQLIAGHCRTWPAELRPDMVFVGAGTSQVDRALASGALSRLLGLSCALADAGWTQDALAALRPLLDPPRAPGIDPSRILACLGTRDSSTPYATALALLDRWEVPPDNRIVYDAGHIALYARLIRSDTAVGRIARLLRRPP